jgi:hypothetical protein
MEYNTLLQLAESDPAKLISRITAVRYDSGKDALQYEPENHAIFDKAQYKDREVWLPVKDENGQNDTTDTGEQKLRREYEKVPRISSVLQKEIVDWAVNTCAAIPAEPILTPQEPTKDEQTIFEMLKTTFKDNKMAYQDREILRLVMIHKIVAEIWYREEDKNIWKDIKGCDPFKMRLVVLSPETGDLLYPVKNNIGKMIALGREYITIDDDNKEQKKFDIFTSEKIQTFGQAAGGWVLESEIPIEYGKANFIVHQQSKTEWEDQQPRIDRLEITDSSLASTNDALGSPILAITGQVIDFGKRGDAGKIFELEQGSSMSVVESASAPESVRFERENLLKGIYSGSATPQLSFDDAAGFGANIPGITLKLLFLPTTLKAMGRQTGSWGMSYQRRINFLLYAMATICKRLISVRDVDVSVKFTQYMPSNDTETYDNAVKLYSAGLLSIEKAVEMVGIAGEDLKEELARLDAAAKQAAQSKSSPTLSVA